MRSLTTNVIGGAQKALQRGLRKRLARFLFREQFGGVLAVVGVTTPIVLGAAALAVDVGLWYKSRRDYQTATDAAAVGAAWQRLKGKGTAITSTAKADAARNGLTIGGSVTMAVNNPPLNGAYAGEGEAVEVIVTLPQRTLLAAALWSSSSVTHIVRAVAAVETKGSACILALDQTAPSAVKIWGSTIVEAQGCVIGSNSNASSAIDVGGSSNIKAESFWTPGNVQFGSNANVTLATPPTVDAWALDDPYAGLSVQSFGSCTSSNLNVNSTLTMSPGVYCNGLSFGSQANVTLQPGVYYINGGDFKANAGSKIRCDCPNATDGVTFVLTNSTHSNQIGTVTINGGTDIDLRAPTATNAPYKGVLFFQDPNAPSNGVNKLNGGSDMVLKGAVYFPNQQIQFNGDNNSTSNNCTQIIGRTIEFTGNSTVFNNGCQAAGIEPIKVKGIRLVE